MNRQRNIEDIYRGAGFHWVGDGFRVTNYFPSNLQRDFSPFVLLDYHPPFHYPPSPDRQRGVGVHPHRGFETVTIAFEGSVAHHDSSGNAGEIGPGDVQGMTAGSGILHKEYHEKEFARLGGVMHMAQLWVNLPRASKMQPPGYQALSAGDMGIVKLTAGAGQARVIAGAYDGVRGPAKTATPVKLFDMSLNQGGRVHLSFPARENTAFLVMSGDVLVNGRTSATALDFVLFENDGTEIEIEALTTAHLLLLSGEPIGETVVQHGPFVMNSRQEIRQAITDFKSGKFGYLAD